MTDITIQDLRDDQQALLDGSDDTDDSGSDADWVMELVDRLDERGYLDAMLAQQFDIDADQVTADAPDPTGGGDGVEGIDADTVAQFGTVVIDHIGDVPISQVVKFARSNPDQVNQLIDQVTGGEASGVE